MTDLILRPLADAFLEVGVFVALLVAPFGLARLRWGAAADRVLTEHARWAPALGAAMTAPPGCAGAIIVVTLYARRAVSFGTAVAALVATMGDATWVLLAADPVLTLQLKGVLILTGAVTGYVVDALGIDPRRSGRPEGTTGGATSAPGAVRPVGGAAPAAVLETVTTPVVAPSRTTTVLPATFWVVAGVGVCLGLPVAFQLVDPVALATATGGVDLYLILGLAGFSVAAACFLAGGGRPPDQGDEPPTTAADVLRGGAHEVAFVTVWVAVAYLAWQVLSTATGFDGSTLPVLGVVGVLVGAAVGLIPGCGVQIVFAGLFVTGGVPLPTLLANTVSQDGDALLPMLAMAPRAAVLATLITTVPAVAVGLTLLLLT